MAVTFVQAGGNDSAAGAGIANMGGSTPVDNLLVAFFCYSGTWSSMSDDNGNAWTQLGSEVVAGGIKGRLYWTKNATAAVDTIRNVTTGSTGFNFVGCIEVSGQDPTTPIDTAQLVAHAGATADFTDTLTLAAANELFLSMIFPDNGTSCSIVSPAGWTNLSTSEGKSWDYQLFGSSGATGVTYDDNNFPTAENMVVLQVAVQATAGGGGPTDAQLAGAIAQQRGALTLGAVYA